MASISISRALTSRLKQSLCAPLTELAASQESSSRLWQPEPWGQRVVMTRGKGSTKKGAHFNPAGTRWAAQSRLCQSNASLRRPVPFPLPVAGPFARRGFKCLRALRPHSVWQGLGRGWKPQQIVASWPFTERQGGEEYVFTTLSTQGGRQEVSLPQPKCLLQGLQQNLKPAKKEGER